MVIHIPHGSDCRIDEINATQARALGELATNFYPGMDWQAVEPQMAADWTRIRGRADVPWAQVRDEVHAAWQVAKLQADGRMCDDTPVMPRAA